MSDAIPNRSVDGLYQIDTEATRRRFLSVLSAAGIGLAGIRKATERAFGETPDGVPLVWRYDRYGKPETIRYIPKERHRRIEVYENLQLKKIHGRTGVVNGITLEQESEEPTDLVLKIYVDDNNPSVRSALPNQIKKVPVIIQEREVDRELRTCDPRKLDFYDPLPANPKITGRTSSDDIFGDGTLGVVCWNDNSDNAYRCYLTSAHTITDDNGNPAEYLHHGGHYNGGSCEENVGSYVTHSELDEDGMDVAKYKRRGGTVDPDVRGNADDSLGDLQGTWTHAGLTDRTSGSQSLPVEFAGQETCYATVDCIDTQKNVGVEYEAVYSPDETEKGDSGGPFLDSDDYLVGLLSEGGVNKNYGPTAHELLDRVNASLSDPTGISPS